MYNHIGLKDITHCDSLLLMKYRFSGFGNAYWCLSVFIYYISFILVFGFCGFIFFGFFHFWVFFLCFWVFFFEFGFFVHFFGFFTGFFFSLRQSWSHLHFITFFFLLFSYFFLAKIFDQNVYWKCTFENIFLWWR